MSILPHRAVIALLLLLASAPASARVPATPPDSPLPAVSVQNLPADLQVPVALALGDMVLVDTRGSGAPAHAVHFSLSAPRRLRLEILDRRGRVVRTLARGLWAAGSHVQAWYGEDDGGSPVHPGLYRVRLGTEPAMGSEVVRR
jgi:hypothetical protein